MLSRTLEERGDQLLEQDLTLPVLFEVLSSRYAVRFVETPVIQCVLSLLEQYDFGDVPHGFRWPRFRAKRRSYQLSIAR